MAFTFEGMVAEIRTAAKQSDPEGAIYNVLSDALKNMDEMVSATPVAGEDEVHLFEDDDLSIWHCRFQPHVVMPPHEHRLKVLIAGYSGSEKSVLYTRTENGLEEAETVIAHAGQVITLDENAIHTVIAEGDVPSLAVHVYLGPLMTLKRDLFNPDTGSAVDFTLENFSAMKRPVTN
ncbi:MAG: hypothetical protein ACR2O1_07260 [Boseongicola sp.]